MRFLLTNDDGWGAEGMLTLEKAASQFGEVITVAPAEPQSGISHQLTFERLLTLEEKAPNSYALNGTPADCARIGLTQLGLEFDWVLSGINHGANLGADTYVSGTVAAAREAWLQGTKALSFSQFRLGGINQTFTWLPSETMAVRVLKEQFELNRTSDRCLVNVNFPDLTERVEEAGTVEFLNCERDPNPLPTQFEKRPDGFMYNGIYRDRAKTDGHDVDVCFGGRVAITRLG